MSEQQWEDEEREFIEDDDDYNVDEMEDMRKWEENEGIHDDDE